MIGLNGAIYCGMLLFFHCRPTVIIDLLYIFIMYFANGAGPDTFVLQLKQINHGARCRSMACVHSVRCVRGCGRVGVPVGGRALNGRRRHCPDILMLYVGRVDLLGENNRSIIHDEVGNYRRCKQ